MAINEIRKHYPSMSKAERKVSDYILQHPGKIISMSIAELSKRSDTSDATIVRMCRHIGFNGFYQLKISIAGDLSQENVKQEFGRTAHPDIGSFFDGEMRYLKEALENVDADIFSKCVDLINRSGTIFTGAWGNTGEIAADFAHRLTLKGIKTFVSDVPEYTIRSLNLAEKSDVLVIFSHSGESTHVVMCLEIAKEIGLPSILVTGTATSKAETLADYTLCAEAEGDVFQNLGGASHAVELMIVDALLYFLEDRNKKGQQAEMLLSRYRM